MASQRLQIPIDKFGRVVLPKEVRDRLGIIPGTEFEVEETEEAILLKPVSRKARLIRVKGVLVIEAGKMLTKESAVETIQRVREERNKALW